MNSCSAPSNTIIPFEVPAADGGDAGSSSGSSGSSGSTSGGLISDASSDGPVVGTSCERQLDVGMLSISNEACFVNQHVENQTTKLLFPCSGGAATATFGSHTFSGTVTGDTISLTDAEPFVFNDCNWISTETIVGDLAKGTVTYTYSEMPKTTCPDFPCTASGSLMVSAGQVVVVN